MVRPFTKPDDVHGMIASNGILTSEAAPPPTRLWLPAQFGVPCIVGASMIED